MKTDSNELISQIYYYRTPSTNGTQHQSVALRYQNVSRNTSRGAKIANLLRAGLCDTTFTFSNTLIRAVLTGPADLVCHIGILTPCI